MFLAVSFFFFFFCRVDSAWFSIFFRDVMGLGANEVDFKRERTIMYFVSTVVRSEVGWRGERESLPLCVSSHLLFLLEGVYRFSISSIFVLVIMFDNF